MAMALDLEGLIPATALPMTANTGEGPYLTHLEAVVA
jgi:hypothetical protein